MTKACSAWQRRCPVSAMVSSTGCTSEGERDDVEHLADRGLIVERFLQLASARRDLVEQPHVLDCDYRLVSESGCQLDLLVAERSYLRARQRQRANRNALAQQRNTERCPVVANLLNIKSGVSRIGEHISDLDGLAFQHG